MSRAWLRRPGAPARYSYCCGSCRFDWWFDGGSTPSTDCGRSQVVPSHFGMKLEAERAHYLQNCLKVGTALSG
ncbi:MAG: hypothetical protein ABI895_25260 [Deltaproteobacteria bacterium]